MRKSFCVMRIVKIVKQGIAKQMNLLQHSIDVRDTENRKVVKIAIFQRKIRSRYIILNKTIFSILVQRAK